MKLQQNRSIIESARAMGLCPKNSYCALTLVLEPSNSKLFKILSYLNSRNFEIWPMLLNLNVISALEVTL